MPSARGPCRASITWLYYNKITQKCLPFIWGGYEGNGNNFITELECGITCRKLEEPLEGDNLKTTENTAGYYSFSTTGPFIYHGECSIILLHLVYIFRSLFLRGNTWYGGVLLKKVFCYFPSILHFILMVVSILIYYRIPQIIETNTT